MAFGLHSKGQGTGLRQRTVWILLAFLLCANATAQAASTTFSFVLDEPSKTSAGVFAADGTLIRTLWGKIRYPAGTNSAVWDGLDDNSNAVAAGVYQIKVLQHNTEYVWDGAIGNTSENLSGPTVHTGFTPMQDMAIAGTNAFYVSGYNEGKYDFRMFYTTDAQKVQNNFAPGYNPANIYDRNWAWTATDGKLVYFACSAATVPTTGVDNVYPGFITAFNVSDQSHAYFSAGNAISNGPGPNEIYPNGIYVGTQAGLSGLTVQQNGNLLAASVAPDNRIYLMDKTSGAAIANFGVTAPQRLAFSPDGSIWVISGTSVICYTNSGVNYSPSLTIPGFMNPLDVAVNPTNAGLILVADGSTSQQVKAFSNTGASLWTYGLPGGYQANGIAVTTNKFWFNNGGGEVTFLCFAPDGSFWVGDAGNHRVLHFSAARNYLEQIMYQPHAYIACVDQNNPSRVFSQFLEFSVDYTKPLPQAWTLVNNWKINVDAAHISWNGGLFDDEGIIEVTTFTNGRTYALVDNNNYSPPQKELCELTTNGLRMTGIFPIDGPGRWISLGPDGSARATSVYASRWFESTLAGFDTNNNPVWNPETVIATSSTNATDPMPRGGSFGNIRASISSNNILISFDQSLNNGWHLGGIRVGGSNWLWKVSPAVAFMNGTGNYEISNSVTYAGNTLQAVDRNVIYGYHGEFFRGQGEACQHMHFYDDGLFVGQFGEANPGHSAYEGALPGTAGNGHCPNLMKTTNGDYYLWVNDESDHGPQRWHFVNARNIREQTGSGTLGSTITLTASQAYGFPAGVSGKHGNQSAELSWLPVPGATSYNIRYSQMNGGPYSTIAGTTSNLDYVAFGLTNGQTYYFAVTAVQAGVESIPSEQVPIYPFDTTHTVSCAGSVTDGGQFTPVIEVSSGAPPSGQPSYIGSEQYTGLLNPRELDYYGYGNLQNETLGTKGYVIYDPQGFGSTLQQVISPFTITTNSGWANIANLERQYRVDSVLETNYGWVAAPLGSINIQAADTNFHYLTVVSPAYFNFPRQFNLRLTSSNNSSAVFPVNEPIGFSHIYQFLFKGNATLTADGTGGSGAIVQALFLDNAPVTYASQGLTLAPPTGLHVVTAAGGNTGGLGSNFVSSYIPNGLVQWNKFNDGTGTVAADASGYGNTLPLVGAPSWGQGYLALNGSSQYGDAGGSQLAALDQHDLTICAWINKTSASMKGIVDKSFGMTSGPSGGWGFWVGADNHLDWAVPGTAGLEDTGFEPLPLGQWTFVTVIWHNSISRAEFYINGVLSSKVQSGGVVESSSGSAHLEVGNLENNASGGLYAFDGSMHDVGIYNRALSAAEVQSNYFGSAFNTNVSVPDLLYYKMTEFAQSNPPVYLADSSTHGGTTGTVNSSYVIAWVTNIASIPSTAIHFNGVSTAINTSNSTLFNFTTNLFTVNFWVRPLTANGYLMQNGAFQGNGWYISVGAIYQIKFGTEANGIDNAIITTGPVAAEGAWTMVTVVRTGLTTASIYINGIQAATTGNGITSPAPSSSSLVIGVDQAAAHWFDGDIWQPQIWGEALAPTDVANLYFRQSTGQPWP